MGKTTKFEFTAEAKVSFTDIDANTFGTDVNNLSPAAKALQASLGRASGGTCKITKIEAPSRRRLEASSRRRLNAGVEIDYEVTTTDTAVASSMATTMSNSTAFAAALVADVAATAGDALTITAQALAVAEPAYTTEIEYTVSVVIEDATDTAAASTLNTAVAGTLSDPAKLTSIMDASKVAGTPSITKDSIAATATQANVAPPVPPTPSAETAQGVKAIFSLAVTVAAAIPGSTDYDAVKATEFKTAFAADVAAALGVSSWRIVIVSITKGSTIVEFVVASDANGNDIAPTAVTSAFAGTVALTNLASSAVGKLYKIPTSVMSPVTGVAAYMYTAPEPAPEPAAVGTSAPAATVESSSSVGVIIGAAVGAVALGVLAFLGMKFYGGGTSSGSVAPARPAMMSPSAAAYVIEEGDDGVPGAPTAGKPSGRKVRKLSF